MKSREPLTLRQNCWLTLEIDKIEAGVSKVPDAGESKMEQDASLHSPKDAAHSLACWHWGPSKPLSWETALHLVRFIRTPLASTCYRWSFSPNPTCGKGNFLQMTKGPWKSKGKLLLLQTATLWIASLNLCFNSSHAERRGELVSAWGLPGQVISLSELLTEVEIMVSLVLSHSNKNPGIIGGKSPEWSPF